MKNTQGLGPLVFTVIVIAALIAWRTQLVITTDRLLSAESISCVTAVDRWSPKSGAADAQPVALPDDWLRGGFRQTDAYYRHRFDGTIHAGQLEAVLFPSVNLNIQLQLNDSALDAVGRMEKPITHNNFTPLLFELPADLLTAGVNELQMRVTSFPPGHGFLGQFCLGPQTLLAQAYRNEMLLGPGFARAITLLSMMFTVIMALVWVLRRSETLYGWMASTLFFWTLHSLKYHVAEVPISSLFWAWYLFSTSISAGVSSFFLIQSFRKKEVGRWNRWLLYGWGFSILLISVLALRESLNFYNVAESISGVALLLVAIAFFRSLPSIWRSSPHEAHCLILSFGMAILLVAHDNMLVFGMFTRTSGQLAILGVPILLGVFAYMVLRRLVQALDEREQLVYELEARSEARALRIVDLEKSSALAEQRESIMRDMHDGLGGYLVSLLAIADQPQLDRRLLHSVVQQALTDMRLMLDSLDIESDDLSLIMGALRDRMQPILQAGGISVDWRIEDTPPLHDMSPHRALQVLRIVQEGLNNAIRHSEADKIEVHLHYDVERLRYGVAVSDDGTGMSEDRTRGRGLDNMRYRAADIGATIEIASTPGQGTRVQLWIPQSESATSQAPSKPP